MTTTTKPKARKKYKERRPRRVQGPTCYIRYYSKLTGRKGKPITKRVIRTEHLTRDDIVVAVSSRDDAGKFYLHLDRVNGRVYALRSTAKRVVDTPDKFWVGVYGEFVTP